MDTVLYADVLFLIDFSMDYLSLFAAAKLLSLRTTWLRSVLAAVMGGLYGIASVLWLPGGVIGAVLTVGISLLMSLTAFGLAGGPSSLLRSTLTVWGCGALLGGIMTAFSTLFGGTFTAGGGDVLCAGGLALLGSIRFARRQFTRGYADLVIPWETECFEARALIDSGNLLRDPVSGYPVVLLSVWAARGFLGELADTAYRGETAYVPGGVRIVPMHGVNGTRLLYGFLCRDLQIRRGRRTVRRCAVICVDHGAAESGYAGCPALLPASLLL